MLAYRSLAARCNLLSRPLCAPPIAPSLSRPRCFQGSIHQNNFPSFVAMERSQDASNNAAKHKTKRSPMQRWRPISTEAVPKGANLEERSDAESKQVVENYTTSSEHLALGGTTNIDIEVSMEAASTSENSFALKSNTAKVVIEETMEEIDVKKDLDRSDTSNKHSSSVEVDAPLIRFLKGKSGSMQKQIEEETGVKIIFPSSKEETCVVLEGNTAESIIKASERIARVLEEAVKSPMLDYSYFISLPLAIHPDLVEKLNNFQSSILRTAASSMDSDKEEDDQEEGTSDEMDYEDKQAEGPSVSVKLRVEKEEHVKVKMDTKLSKPDLGIDKSIFIKPKMFHLTVLMLKLWNKDRVARASEVLQSISNQVKEALENRPISIQLRGLTCMKGSPARARVVYAPVLEVGGEGRLERACKVIIDAFAESGLVLEKDSRHELKLHATIMNVRHRKSKKRNRRNDSFDARHIFRVYGQQEWGEYHIPEVHLSQRFKFDENGYYHCCSSIALPEGFQVE